MSHFILPKGTILDNYIYYRVINGHKVWCKENKKRYFSWDSLHGEIEVFDLNGKHLGALNPFTGQKIKDAKKGRHLNVR